MVEIDESQLDAAEARGRVLLETAPRAVAAHYEAKSDRVVLDLANGCVYAFPTDLVEDLQGATAKDLGAVEVDGLGFNLHFPALDVDLQVPALIAGVFGTKAWMTRELARRAGQVTSEAKAAAARANGAKGGRPRRVR
jgi:Protein of unknown function (DUF2442)